MRKRGEFPVTVKVGNAAVKIYRVRHKTTASGFAYAVATRSADGKRHLAQFADLADATQEARLKAAQLNAGRIEGADMTRTDRDELQAAREAVGDVPLLAAITEWKKARELTAGNLLPAAEAWASRNGSAYEQISVNTAVQRFILAKKRAGIDVKASYDKILPSLVLKLGERTLGTVSARELGAWLEERYPHPVSRNTARKRIVALWRWCRDEHYLPRDAKTEAEFTKTAQEDEGEIGIISAETFGRLLHYFKTKHPHYLPALAVAGFCGLRRAEIHTQQWEDVDLQAAHVRVTKAKRNTPSKRLTPLSPSAVQWLLLCPDRKGPICENLAIDRIRHIALAAKDDEGKPLFPDLPDNAFRHSFISHRVAATGNVAETSLEAGNSPRVIFQHYRSLVTKSEGQAWFAIPTEPAKPAEVIDIKGKAASA
jgi:integrase